MRSRRRSLQSEPNQNSTTFNLEYFVRVPLGMLLTHRVVHSSFVQAINEVIVPALDLQMGSFAPIARIRRLSDLSSSAEQRLF
jgi:hypothetical protein